MDVVGLGKACIDFLVNIEKLPKINERSNILEYSWQGGGMVPTALVALAKLGADVGFLGTVGNDSYGKSCIDELNRYGVDTSRTVIDEKGSTPFSVVLSENEAFGRNILHHPGSVQYLQIDQIDMDYALKAKYLHLSEVLPTTVYLAEVARKNGIKVVFDADRFYPKDLHMLKHIDVFIASEACYNHLFSDQDYEKNLREIANHGPQITVFTFGTEGAKIFEANRYFEISAFRVDVKDTTGAGDVYHGAFIYGLLQGWSTEKTATFASAVAAIKCTRIGGRAGIPDLETTLRFISTGKLDFKDTDKTADRLFVMHG